MEVGGVEIQGLCNSVHKGKLITLWTGRLIKYIHLILILLYLKFIYGKFMKVIWFFS